MPTRVKLRPGRFQIGHGPWIHKDEVAKVLGPPDPADLVEVLDQRDQTVGWGLVSPDADLRVRLVAHGAARPPDDWLERRLHAALAARAALGLAADPDTDAYREVNSEGDGLPGLTVDRYGDDRVVQLATPAMAARRDALAGFFAARTPGRLFVFAPESAQARERFTLEPQLHGDGAVLEYRQSGLVFATPAPPAQKTGAYLDQRDNQRLVAGLAARVGGPVLDLGCHVGGFALHAAARGLDVVGLDQSARALEFARRNAARNDLSSRTAWVQADMFAPLTDPALAGPFGVVVVDPPRMVSRPGQVERGRLALRECLARVIPRLRPGGFLVVCSCSHHLDRRHLDEAVLAAARSDPAAWPAGPELTRVHALGPGPDHPVWPAHQQGEYLRVNVYQRRDP
jgi:23S rRNA (cytosine1962-C5)-methyltransferase